MIGKAELEAAYQFLNDQDTVKTDRSPEQSTKVIKSVIEYLDLNEEELVQFCFEQGIKLREQFTLLDPMPVRYMSGVMLGLHIGMVVERQRAEKQNN